MQLVTMGTWMACSVVLSVLVYGFKESIGVLHLYARSLLLTGACMHLVAYCLSRWSRMCMSETEVAKVAVELGGGGRGAGAALTGAGRASPSLNS